MRVWNAPTATWDANALSNFPVRLRHQPRSKKFRSDKVGTFGNYVQTTP